MWACKAIITWKNDAFALFFDLLVKKEVHFLEVEVSVDEGCFQVVGVSDENDLVFVIDLFVEGIDDSALAVLFEDGVLNDILVHIPDVAGEFINQVLVVHG